MPWDRPAGYFTVASYMEIANKKNIEQETQTSQIIVE